MTQQEAQELLTKYHEGKCTPEEKAIVEQWYQNESSRAQFPDEIGDPDERKEEIWDAIREMSGLEDRRTRRSEFIRRLSAAAIIVFIMSAGLYFFKQQQPDLLVENKPKPVTSGDIDPGGDKAILTLADGSKIMLDDKGKGLIATQSGISISKSADGTVTYQVTGDQGTGKTPTYNTIETPKGGKYQIMLPDGSKVWLNAASTLKFPTSFSGPERIVDLTGEAYFEVAKNTKQPFRVHTADMNVFVTGTQFNVMAYNDEGYTATTLVEGSVNVNKKGQRLVLVPGEQALSNAGTSMTKREVDVDQIIAWKNGLFQFNSSDIQSVMRQIGRWYDISVEYRGRIPSNRFGGYISRDSKLSQVIKMLELSGVKFTVEDKKIIVLP